MFHSNLDALMLSPQPVMISRARDNQSNRRWREAVEPTAAGRPRVARCERHLRRSGRGFLAISKTVTYEPAPRSQPLATGIPPNEAELPPCT
jgi:hypothetical protein